MPQTEYAVSVAVEPCRVEPNELLESDTVSELDAMQEQAELEQTRQKTAPRRMRSWF